MDNILEQIQSLTDKFNNLFETIYNRQGKEANSLFDKTKITQELKDLASKKYPKRTLGQAVKRLYKDGEATHSTYSTSGYYQQKSSPNEHTYHVFDIKKDKKMNDNNSFNEVIAQINNLTEQFSNLFEVEGLGDPSGDVPPSTNKIKKDKKTKDGKVELVSVEDELFPKEGNAKEQFRQKVIDKINGMIQGTATLEDLLQLVRSKQAKPVKEGFEGAIEILEDIMTAIDKSSKSPEKKEELKRKAEDNQEKELHTLHNYKKLEGSKVPLDIELKRKETKNTKGEHGTDERRAVQARSKFKKLGMFDKGYEQARDRFQRALDVERAHSVKEGFEGAIKLLENIIAERKYSEEEIREIAKKVRPERAKKFNKACDELDKVTQGKNPDKFTTVQKYRANKAAEKVGRTQDRLNHVDDIINPPVKTPTGIKRANESFEQAISQIDDLINCLGESKSATELSSVAKKVLPQREAEAKKAHAEVEHATRLNPYGMLNGKISQRQREVIANALNKAEKADNKVAKAKSYLEKPKEKQSSGIKFDKILCSHEDKTNEGLFIEDGRGDLIDDVSKVITGKTVKQHLQDIPKKLIKKKAE